ncbi:MAG: YceI family protein [Chloroflexi bacterium]|nr:YceI family protein [Chloroflexota bacterium]
MNIRSRFSVLAMLLITAACSTAILATPTLEPTIALPTIDPQILEDELFRTFVIVPEESKASYTVEEEFLAGALRPLGIDAGFNTAFGWTRNIQGQLSLNLNKVPPQIGESFFVVELRSLSSDQDRRDEMIQRQFLESNLFPLAEFVVTAIDNFPSEAQEGQVINFILIGDMTIREITHPFTFEVEAILENGMLTGTAIGLLTMTDFGFDPPSIAGILTVSDPAIITLEFTMKETIANPQ